MWKTLKKLFHKTNESLSVIHGGIWALVAYFFVSSLDHSLKIYYPSWYFIFRVLIILFVGVLLSILLGLIFRFFGINKK